MRKTIMSRYENTLSKSEETLLAARRLSREKHRATESDLAWERGGNRAGILDLCLPPVKESLRCNKSDADAFDCWCADDNAHFPRLNSQGIAKVATAEHKNRIRSNTERCLMTIVVGFPLPNVCCRSQSVVRCLFWPRCLTYFLV